MPFPRLLPTTIVMLAALLMLKIGILSQTAITHGSRPDSVILTAAKAAGTEAGKEHAKPSGGHAAPERKTQVPDPPAPTIPEGPPPVSESEKALLQELRQRRRELDARADALSVRESILAATEQKLATRVTELQSLQKKLQVLDTSQKQKEDAGWQGLVKLYEAMKPKDAATIFNDLSMSVLLQVLDRMKDAKAASVMAAMNPDKARDVTAELAQLRTGRDGSRASAATLRPSQAGG